jgi:hypothetical protein
MIADTRSSTALPRFAVLTTCYRRWDYLQQALPSWRGLRGLARILVGCLQSDPPPVPLSGVELVPVADRRFHIARLRNGLAQRVRDDATITHLAFIDADIVVKDPRVFTPPAGVQVLVDSPFAVVARPEEAVRPGDPERANGGADRGKRGTHIVSKELFFALNGYDQRLSGWAGEDINLYHRYAKVGARIGYYDRAGIEHIPHGDQERAMANPAGESPADSRHRNHAITFQQPDLYGHSWRDSFGYPEGQA